MPDYEIAVGVAPDASHFPGALREELERAEARAPTFPVELEPRAGKTFGRQARREVDKALADIDATVTLGPDLARAFKRDLRKLVAAQVKGGVGEVPIAPTLTRTFKRDLQKEVKAALVGATATVDVTPDVSRFTRGLRRDLRNALAGVTAAVEVTPDVRRGFGAEVRRQVKAAGVSIPIPIAPTVPAGLRRDLERDLRTALGGKPLSVPIRLDIDRKSLDALRASLARGLSVNIGADTAAARAEIATLGDAGTGVGSTFGKAFSIAMLAAVAGLGIALAAAIGGSIFAAANFEQELSNLRATAGVTGQALADLRQQALDAGAATTFSATEAAQAQTELAKAGASVEQILGGGLPAALALAAAGEIELADAANFVATGLNTFGLGAGEASRVADTLAAAANRSATDIPQMGYALAQSGLVARQFGLTIEETSGTLALFAQNGLVGSDAGTSFRTMLQRLIPQSEQAGETMEVLGLTFFDAQGQFVGIETAAGQLQTALGSLTEEQRAAAIQSIFGADAARAANIVFGAGAPGIAAWTAQVTDSGNAAETAAVKLDNLAGDLEALKGSFETALITSGEGQLNGLRSVVQGLTGVVNEVGPAFSESLVPVGDLLTGLAPLLTTVVAGLGPVFGSLLGVIEPLALAAGSFFSRLFVSVPGLLDSLAPLAVAFGDLLTAAGPLLPVVIGIVAVLAEALAPMVAGLADGLAPLIAALNDGLSPVLEGLAPIAADLGAALGDLITQVGGQLASGLATLLEDNTDLLPRLATAAVDLAAGLADLLVAVLPLVPVLADLAVALLSDALLDLLAAVTPLLPAVTPLVELLAMALVPALGLVADNAESLSPILAALLGGFLAFKVGSFVAGIGAATTALAGNTIAMGANVLAYATSAPAMILSATLRARDTAATVAHRIATVASTVATKAATVAQAAFNAAAAANPVGLIVIAVVALIAGLVALYKNWEPFRELVDSTWQSLQRLWDQILPVVTAIGTDLVGAFQAAWKVLQPVYAALFDLGVGIGRLIIEPILTLGRVIGQVFTGDFGGALETLRAWPGKLLGIFGDILGSLGDWAAAVGPIILDGLKALGGLWLELVGWVWEGVKQLPGALLDLYLALAQWALDVAPDIASAMLGLVGSLLSWVIEAAVSLPFRLADLYLAVAAWALSVAPDIASAVLGLAGDLLSWVVQAAVSLPFRLLDLVLAVAAWAVTVGPEIAAAVLGLAGDLLGWVVEAVTSLPFRLADLYLALWAWVIETGPKIVTAVAGFAGDLLSWVGSAILTLPGRLADLAGTIFAWAAGLPGQIASAAGDVFGFLSTKAGEAVDAVVGFFLGLPGRIADLATTIKDAALDLGEDLLNGLVEAITGASDVAGDLAVRIAEGLRNFINDNIIGAINRGIPDSIGRSPLKVDLPDNPIPEIPAFAVGGLVTGPTLALVGEAGPELILPMRDPERLLELLAAAGLITNPSAAAVAGATIGPVGASAATSALPIAATPSATAAAPTGADAEAVVPGVEWAPTAEPIQEWADEVIARFTALPEQVAGATLPGLTVWQAALAALLSAAGLNVTGWTDATVLTLTLWSTLRVPAATMPGLELWRVAVLAVLAALGGEMVASVDMTTVTMAAALDAGLAALVPIAALQGAAIVAALVAELEAGARRVGEVTTTYRGSLADALNPVLEAVGEPPLRFAEGGEVIRLARGGYIPGPLTTTDDTVPAMLMTGEYVLTRDMTADVGLGFLEQWRRRSLAGFAEGGLVTGDTEGLNTEFTRRLGAWSAALGRSYHVGSGYRSIEEQQRLYASYLAGTGNLAAPPGKSMHNFGLAADGPHWRHLNPGMFGLAYTVPSEGWHVEPVEAREWAGVGDLPMMGLLPFPEVPTGAEGWLAQAAEGAMSYAREKALAWAQERMFASPGTLGDGGAGGAVSEEQAALWVRTAMAITGVPERWFAGLMTIARRESGLNPKAINLWDSNAAKGQPSQGFMQTIPSTFAAYALPGLGDILNPVHSTVAAIRYILDRYGDISRVQQADPNRPPKGYREGGLVTDEGVYYLAAAQDPASVIDLTRRPPGPGDDPAVWAELFRRRRGGGDGPPTVGEVNIHVKPPTGAHPESYGQGIATRTVPVLAAVIHGAG